MKLLIRIFISLFFLTSTVNAAEFGLAFEWGNLKLCTSGNPNKVDNPIFTLTNVPEGTKILQFRMKDKQSPYNHGGGKVEYTGQTTIEPGAFKYKNSFQKGLKIAFFAVNLLFILTNFVDFEYYKFTGRRSSSIGSVL